MEPVRISAPPPDFDDGPGGETKQTPKDELARWRRMAAREVERARTGDVSVQPGDRTLDERDLVTQPAMPAEDEPTVTSPAQPAAGHDEPTRAVQNPLAPGADRPSAPMPWTPMREPRPSSSEPAARIEPPTRELSLSSDVIALSRRDTTGSIRTSSVPPRAPPPRPALRPMATSLPPELPIVPSPAPIGVSMPPGALASPSSAGEVPASRGAAYVALAVIALALVGAAALLTWPATDPLAAPAPPLPPPVGAVGASAPVTTVPATPGPGSAPSSATTPAPIAPMAIVASAPTTPPSPVAPAPIAPAPAAAPAPVAAAAAPAAAPSAAVPAPAPVSSATPTPAPEAAAPEAMAPEAAAPATPAIDDARSVEALVERGDAAMDADRPGDALALYQRAIALDGHAAYAFAGAARACIALSRGADAVRFAERAVAHRQRRASFRVLLGDAHAAAGSMDEARAAWERALELDPDDRTAAARLGR
jgi:hypothetical protein